MTDRTKSVDVTLSEAEAAIRAKADSTTNPSYRRYLRLVIHLLDWAREA